jgi:hypothetical protein
MQYLGKAILIVFGLIIILPIMALVPGLGATILVVAVALWYFNSYRPRQQLEKAAEQQRAHEFELAQQQRDAEEARERAARENRVKQQETLRMEQDRLEEEARTGFLRSMVNELLDYANMLTPTADKAELVGAMHAVVGKLTERKDIKSQHFDDEMLQFDISLVFRRLEDSGLGNDLVVERLRKVLRQGSVASPTVVVSSTQLVPDPIALPHDNGHGPDRIEPKKLSSDQYIELLRTANRDGESSSVT